MIWHSRWGSLAPEYSCLTTLNNFPKVTRFLLNQCMDFPKNSNAGPCTSKHLIHHFIPARKYSEINATLGRQNNQYICIGIIYQNNLIIHVLSWINQVASHSSPNILPSWWKSVFAQDESRGGTDPIGKTYIIPKLKQIPNLALSFLPLAPIWVCLLVWNNITVNQGYKNTEHSSLVWGIWSWSKSLLNKISKIEWNRICLTFLFSPPQRGV